VNNTEQTGRANAEPNKSLLSKKKPPPGKGITGGGKRLKF
jgi:hypothetical protein